MWCHNCGQDVPRVASPDSGKLCCLRCGKPVGQQPSARRRRDPAPGKVRRADSPEAKPAGVGRRPSGYDGWEFDEDLRHIGRLLGAAGPAGAVKKAAGKKHRRVDAAHALLSGPHYGRRPATTEAGSLDPGGALVGGIAWVSLTLGLMASVCGGVLLIWSAVVHRDDLWSFGLPITLAGLLGLVVAMVLQMDRLSGHYRQAAARLDRFDSRLTQLRRDAAISAADVRPAGAAFYAHLADGASPQLLLSDLKGQLELLTQRLGESEGAAASPDDAE